MTIVILNRINEKINDYIFKAFKMDKDSRRDSAMSWFPWFFSKVAQALII